jgi:ribosomal protein S18 acetylase RimI-like enzyme
VLPAYRGYGLGKQLWLDCLEYYRNLKPSLLDTKPLYIKIDVTESSVSWFEKAGFHKVDQGMTMSFTL